MLQPPNYHEVFVVHGPALADLLPSLVTAGMAIVFALAGFLNRRFGLDMQRGSLSAARIGAPVLAVVAVLASMVILQDFHEATARYRGGHYSVVEGRVTDFTPGSTSNPRDEDFRVGEQEFHYSPWELSPYFHRLAEKGGPIRPGLRVRISHVNGDILRLEIAP
jgi:hypothetical protein